MTTAQDIKTIKKLIIDTVKPSNAGHITSSFSVAEILYAIYKVADITPQNIADKIRDRVIISKEHCRLAQVAILGYLGMVNTEDLKNYCKDGEHLGHDMYNIVCPQFAAVDVASGSLGHGLSVSAGLAMATPDKQIYCLCGDGEFQEGSMWEAALFIRQHNLKNLTIIVDRNYMQIDNWTKNIIDSSSHLKEQFIAFGFDVIECDGHDVQALITSLKKKSSKPKCIIANTIKGKGIEFLLKTRGFAMFHHSGLNKEEFIQVYEAIKND
ncbi:MAG: transketolase [Alphaproteobacteria bacterium]|nr:transketolase [Alphaproteobacteria bacterium]